jgi:hypothetical protein
MSGSIEFVFFKCLFRNGLSSILTFLVPFVCLFVQIPEHFVDEAGMNQFQFVVCRDPVLRRSTIRDNNSV